MGAHGEGGELVLFEDCAAAAKSGALTHGFEFAPESGVVKNGDLCVTADVNGTKAGGGGGGGKNRADSAFLFNVVQDPTEQHNLINDTAQAERVATMARALSLEVAGFFSNKDKFVNDCPANLDPEKDLGCACWMAKHKYGGFMGPFAMLPEDEKPVFETP